MFISANMENPADLLARFRPADIQRMVEGDLSLRKVLLGMLPAGEGEEVCGVLRIYLSLNPAVPEELVYEFLRQHNPETYRVFVGNPKARAWLKKNLKSFSQKDDNNNPRR